MEAGRRRDPGSPSPEQTATRLVGELKRVLRHNEDVETGVDVYKTANWIIGQLEKVKEEALALAEADIDQRGLENLDTPTGSAGWTEPEVPKLNEEAWQKAMGKDSRLREIQREYDAARSTLERAQRPYMELPASRFSIRCPATVGIPRGDFAAGGGCGRDEVGSTN